MQRMKLTIVSKTDIVLISLKIQVFQTIIRETFIADVWPHGMPIEW